MKSVFVLLVAFGMGMAGEADTLIIHGQIMHDAPCYVNGNLVGIVGVTSKENLSDSIVVERCKEYYPKTTNTAPLSK